MTKPTDADMIAPALAALKHQKQIDEDGCEVGVSRQALDEVIAYCDRLAYLTPEITEHRSARPLGASGRYTDVQNLTSKDECDPHGCSTLTPTKRAEELADRLDDLYEQKSGSDVLDEIKSALTAEYEHGKCETANLLDEMYQFIKDMGFTRKESLKSWRANLLDDYAQIRKIGVHKERSHG